MRTRIVAAGLVLVLGGSLCAVLVSAQESRRGERVLHRHLDLERWQQSQKEAGGQAPRARPRARADRTPGEAPGLEVAPRAEEWIWTSAGPVGPGAEQQPHGEWDPGRGETELDDDTDRVESLDYQALFDPSVVPLKRGVAQNRVLRQGDGRYVAFTEAGVHREVPTQGSPRQGEDLFWGTFLVRLEPGQRHPIPSVAPNQRVLELQSEPPVGLRLEMDEADNFYLRGDHDGRVRVNMRIAAPQTYFDGEFDAGVNWAEFPRGATPLPGDLRGLGLEVLAEIVGVDPARHTPREALYRLVEYYRDFEGRPFDGDEQGDRFVEITKAQVGVCRHRSLGFLVAALSLGIPTRYVFNEAHAFVEVRWPGIGWRRIDLGGAADEFNYQNEQTGAIHEGGWNDDLPTPRAYEEELARQEGLSGGPMTEGRGAGEALGLNGEAGSDDEAGSGRSRPSGGEPVQSREEMGQSEVDAGAVMEPGAEAAAVEILWAAGEVLRGQPLRVGGRVDVGGAGHLVSVYLLPAGAQSWSGSVFLGDTTVQPDGTFEGEWPVPSSVRLGRWQLRGRLR